MGYCGAKVAVAITVSISDRKNAGNRASAVSLAAMTPTVIIDTREPWPHPWAGYFPADVRLVRGTLETGDVALAALPEGAVVERKTVPDFLAAIGRERERFERELARSRYCGSFCIIVEGDLRDVIMQARGVNHNALMSTIATWTRRYGPILFAGGQHAAADLAFRFLAGQVREIERAAKALSKAVTP